MGLEPDGAASKYEKLFSAYNKEHGALSRPVAVSKLQALATYKLALIICQEKYPFSATEDFMKFSRVLTHLFRYFQVRIVAELSLEELKK